jgi:hypothetical protein
VAFNGQELMFFGREGQKPNGTKLRRSGSKISNIKEQNQN